MTDVNPSHPTVEVGVDAHQKRSGLTAVSWFGLAVSFLVSGASLLARARDNWMLISAGGLSLGLAIYCLYRLIRRWRDSGRTSKDPLHGGPVS